MSESWLVYSVPKPGAGDPPPTLPGVLQRFGMVGSNPRCDAELMNRIWSDARNRALHTPTFRKPYELKDGDSIQFPAPALPPDVQLRTYSFTGTEKSVDEVCTKILEKLKNGSLELPVVPRSDFNAAYLYALPHNLGFVAAHPDPTKGPFGDKEQLNYPVRVRRVEHRDIVPATDLQPDTRNCVSIGNGVFGVTADLAEEEQILKLVTKHGVSPIKWRGSSVRFTVKITCQTPGEQPIRTTIQVLRPDGSVYYSEMHQEGELVTVGEHEWSWDGFMSPPPAEGEADTMAGFDTRVLRGRMTIAVIVEAKKGVPGRTWLYLDNVSSNGKFVDVALRPGSKEIQGTAWVEYVRITKDFPIWMTSILGMALAAGAVFGVLLLLELFGFWLYSVLESGGHLSEKEKGVRSAVMAGTAGLVVLAALITILVSITKTRLSEKEFDRLKLLLTRGIRACWSHPELNIGSLKYTLSVSAGQRDTDAVRLCCMKPLYENQRGVNLGMVLSMYPVIVSWDPNAPAPRGWAAGYNDDVAAYTGAHEFGHSVLASAVGEDYSIRHKGTTGGIRSQAANASAPSASSVPAGGMFDLMIYYADDYTTPPDFYQRQRATEEDATDFVRIADVEFRKLKLTNSQIVKSENRRF